MEDEVSWAKTWMRRSLWLVGGESFTVIRYKLSLIWKIYLHTLLPTCDKVDDLIFCLTDSIKAMLFLWMKLQMVHRNKGPSFWSLVGSWLIMVIQKSSVKDHSRSFASSLEWNVGCWGFCLSLSIVVVDQRNLASYRMLSLGSWQLA